MSQRNIINQSKKQKLNPERNNMTIDIGPNLASVLGGVCGAICAVAFFYFVVYKSNQ